MSSKNKLFHAKVILLVFVQFCSKHLLAFLVVFRIYKESVLINSFQFDFRVEESKNEDQTILSMIKGMMNIGLMIKPLFLMIIASCFLSMLGFFVPIIFLPNMAELQGIAESKAGFLIVIYGKLVLKSNIFSFPS